MASPLAPTEGSSASREATPVSTASSSRPPDPLSATGSSADADHIAAAAGIVPPGIGPTGQDDMDRFLKRMEMEKKVMQLQQRLELASVKANNGWSDMSIGQIEERLPPSPRLNISPTAARFDLPSPSSAQHRMYPISGPSPLVPSSPRKRRMDEHLDSFPRAASPGRHQHRRASSSATLASFLAADQAQAQHPHSAVASSSSSTLHPGSPLRPRDSKKRSQSHSHRERPTTQDVDAAKALTFMLGSGGTGFGWEAAQGGRRGSAERDRLLPDFHPAPPLTSTSSLPLPDSARRASGSDLNAGNVARHSISATTSPVAPSTKKQATASTAAVMEGRGEDDKAAVELMMFLAHSPSPAKPADPPVRSVGSAARVLFADDPKPSNLSGPPITAMQVKEDVGGLLGA